MQATSLAPSHMPGESPQVLQGPENSSKGMTTNRATRSNPNPYNRGSSRIDAMTNTTRTRLPPRSRFGCWTCRTRKVKCDEFRPACTPCSRLGHVCDYNPRLVFRDDTRRVVEKMKNRGYTENLTWDASTLIDTRTVPDPDKDFLPPFTSLTNDEDREKKAEYRAPGTYHIIVVPSSFMELEEYRESNDDAIGNSNRSRKESRDRMCRASNISYQNSGDNCLDDPDVVILDKFEGDPVSVPALSICPVRSPASVMSSQSSSEGIPPHVVTSASSDVIPPIEIFLQIRPRRSEDNRLIAHFNKFVLRSFAQVHRDALGTTRETDTLLAHNVFAEKAEDFPPLYHALMGLTALSMDNRGGAQNLDALQHYQLALPSLKNSLSISEDLSSDVVLLTHFVLLLYEIAASEPKGSNLYYQHLDQLLRIIKLRSETYGRERYAFIIWWMFVIDTHAVLTGGGDGTYAESLMQNNLLPETLPPAQLAGSLPHRCHDRAPSVLEFHRKIYIHAAELGRLARDFRLRDDEIARRREMPTSGEIQIWQQGTVQARESLQRTWQEHIPIFTALGYTNDQVPVKDRGIFEHTTILYHSLTIYSHISMWPTQAQTKSPPSFLKTCAYSILSLSREIVSAGHLERKFLVFPLFMAGIFFSSGIRSDSSEEREEIVGLLKELEMETMGRVANASRLLLELVFEQREKEGAEVVADWIQLGRKRGLLVVNCRL